MFRHAIKAVFGKVLGDEVLKKTEFKCTKEQLLQAIKEAEENFKEDSKKAKKSEKAKKS